MGGYLSLAHLTLGIPDKLQNPRRNGDLSLVIASTLDVTLKLRQQPLLKLVQNLSETKSAHFVDSDQSGKAAERTL
ncbi:hypothetical protein EFD55_01245 [Rhizobium pisi]|uniref:Uncharacterized protein n=1 Tax=Rhizobium pisi TaxID=574561 RepID=A0A3R9BUV8_9HYPH|nr:hypothetical protein EFD55_01245 [Rhizobium pisi]